MPELVSLTACKMGVNQGAGGNNILELKGRERRKIKH
jgi:hypothetical protein